jgi:hypothetical protein
MTHTKSVPKFYTLTELIELSRQMLRYARSIPRGPERNERRQISDSMRRLFKNKDWLKAHLVGESGTEYRVNTVDLDGTSHQAIKLIALTMLPQLTPQNSLSTARMSNSGREEALLVQKNERVQLEIKIIKHRALARQAPDVETTQRINGLIAELEQTLREIAE